MGSIFISTELPIKNFKCNYSKLNFVVRTPSNINTMTEIIECKTKYNRYK